MQNYLGHNPWFMGRNHFLCYCDFNYHKVNHQKGIYFGSQIYLFDYIRTY